jgi:type II secretory pathway pseudopilin PulG
MKPNRSEAGFSLVETLVALVLFILAIGVLGQAMNNAMRAINILEVTEGRQRDYAFVRDQVLTISDTDAFNAGGDVVTPEAGQAHWQVVETETTATPDLFQVQLSVTLDGQDTIPSESGNQTLYLLRPQWSDPDDRSTLLSGIHDDLAKVRTEQNWP